MGRVKKTPDPWYQDMRLRLRQASLPQGRWTSVNSNMLLTADARVSQFNKPSVNLSSNVAGQEEASEPSAQVSISETAHVNRHAAKSRDSLLSLVPSSSPKGISVRKPMRSSTIDLQERSEDVANEAPPSLRNILVHSLESLSQTTDFLQRALATLGRDEQNALYADNEEPASKILPGISNNTPPLDVLAAVASARTQLGLRNHSPKDIQPRLDHTSLNQDRAEIIRTSAPALALPAFRPIADPFICQREYFGDGTPCPFQRECVHCKPFQNCRRRDCSTEALDSYEKGNCLGPKIDVKSAHVIIPKMCRTSIKHYFGRNKKGSNHINFDDTLLCRKCYQHLAYISKRDPDHKWAKLKSEILRICVEKVEQQQVSRTGQPGVWTIQLKKTEYERLVARCKTGDVGTIHLTEQLSPCTNKKDIEIEKSGRKQLKGSYEAPVNILQHIDESWCGNDRTVEDCHAINDWCRTKLEDGSLADLPLWEHVPQWEGDADFHTMKDKGKSARFVK